MMCFTSFHKYQTCNFTYGRGRNGLIAIIGSLDVYCISTLSTADVAHAAWIVMCSLSVSLV